MLTYGQAIILGILQGITERFPISSLGHSVILPQLLGWTEVVAAQSAPESYFLAFLVGLHVATALALLVFYRATWGRIGRGVLGPVRTGTIAMPDQRLGWLLVVATIPAGLGQSGATRPDGRRPDHASWSGRLTHLIRSGVTVIAATGTRPEWAPARASALGAG